MVPFDTVFWQAVFLKLSCLSLFLGWIQSYRKWRATLIDFSRHPTPLAPDLVVALYPFIRKASGTVITDMSHTRTPTSHLSHTHSLLFGQ